jgi:transposase
LETFKRSTDPHFVAKVHDIVGLVMDNYGTHNTANARAWFAARPRCHVHFTPESASWVNLVERFFAQISARSIKRNSHRSTHELEASIKTYLATYNDDPKPFVWRKTAVVVN